MTIADMGSLRLKRATTLVAGVASVVAFAWFLHSAIAADAKPDAPTGTAIAPSDAIPPAVVEQPKTTKFTLHPAATPFDPLQYHFLPRFIERHPGNAATLYAKAVVGMSEGRGKK